MHAALNFVQALKAYCKAVPDSTYHELEAAFRNMGFNTHLIAKKKELFTTQTLVNIQGKIDCTYEVGFYFSDKPQRKSAKEGWPESKEDNMERLKDAGLPMDRGIPKCGRCGGEFCTFQSWRRRGYFIYADSYHLELGHTVRGCKDEAEEITRVIVKCANCDEGWALSEYSVLLLTRIQLVIVFVIVLRRERANSPAETAEVYISFMSP